MLESVILHLRPSTLDELSYYEGIFVVTSLQYFLLVLAVSLDILNSTQLNAKNGRRRNAPLYPYL